MNYNLYNRFKYLKKYLSKSGEYIKNERAGILKGTQQKDDGSPVTSADIWGNKFWERVIKKEYPNDVFIGEESTSHDYPEGSKFVWYVDPIDGTKEYISGHGPYYTLIGLSIEGKPALGIVHEPETGIIIYGSTDQKPSLYNEDIDEPRELNGIREWKSSNRLMMRGIDAKKRNRLKNHFDIKREKYIDITHNQLAPLFNISSGFVSNRATSYWDLCAPAAIMSAAGFTTEFQNDDQTVLLNNGSHMADRFYILPGDTPEEVKKAVMKW
ncbi:MAG: inositol monophosphatase family protein [Balneolales bacterium]